MKLSKVVLRETGYDPRTEQTSTLNGKAEFAAVDGYAIEDVGEWVRVTWEGRTARFPSCLVRHTVEAVEVVAKPVAAAPAEQPTQQKQWKGKR
jgi:hypothetical protein